MNLIQLERIVFIANVGSITEAAKQLYISQSALSQMVNAVEEELGTQIFDRRVKPLRLTKSGECYVTMARYIMNVHATMLNEIVNIKSGSTGEIRIGISARRANTVMPNILKQLSVEFPNISVRLYLLEPSEFEAYILRGELDIALGSFPPNDPNVGSFVLNDEKYCLVVQRNSEIGERLEQLRDPNDPWAPISLREVRDERFVATPPNTHSRDVLNAMFAEVHIRPPVCVVVPSNNNALDYVKVGLGVAVLPQDFENEDQLPYQTQSLSLFNIDSKYVLRNFYLLYDTSVVVSPPHRYLINQLLARYGAMERALPEIMGPVPPAHLRMRDEELDV